MCITVPPELRNHYPYNASAYAFLQQLREAIFRYGLIEFPQLPVNRCNYTLAQRSPWQHRYSDNPYLTDLCQLPHQDTPPYPTAFWLGQPRRFSATWIVSDTGLESVSRWRQQHPDASTDELHRQLVPSSLADGTGILLNHSPGLLLIDNSHHHRLYHARTCRFDAIAAQTDHHTDTPMYAYNEIGLMNYIDMLDSRRGTEHRNAEDEALTREFFQSQPLPSINIL